MNSPITPDQVKTASPVSASIGHNNPPAFDMTVFDALNTDAQTFARASEAWLDTDIKTEQQAAALTDQISGLRKLYKRVDDTRKAEKKPHDDAGKAVQSAYTPILKILELSAEKLKNHMAPYLIAKQKAEAEEAARKKAEADRIASEAAEAEERAAQGDISAQVEAEEKKRQADALEKAATVSNTSVKSATGAGRTIAMRTVKTAKIINQMAVYLHFKDDPKVVELLQSLATAAIRSKGYDGSIKGVEVITTQVPA